MGRKSPIFTLDAESSGGYVRGSLGGHSKPMPKPANSNGGILTIQKLERQGQSNIRKVKRDG